MHYQQAKKKTLAMGGDGICALREEKGNDTNLDDILKTAEKYHNTENDFEPIDPVGQAPSITKNEVKNALEWMKESKAAGDDGTTADLLHHSGGILIEKLTELFSHRLGP